MNRIVDCELNIFCLLAVCGDCSHKYNSKTFLLTALCVQRLFEIFHNLSVQTYNKLERTIPGFSTIMEKVQVDAAERDAKRKAKRAAQKKAEEEKALFGRVQSDL